MPRHSRVPLILLVMAIVVLLGAQVPNRVLASSISGITLTPTATNTFTPAPPTETPVPTTAARTAEPEQVTTTATAQPTATLRPIIPATGVGNITSSVLGIILAGLGIIIMIVAGLVFLRGRRITSDRQ